MSVPLSADSARPSLLTSPWYFEVVDIIHGIDLGLSSRFGVAAYRGTIERARDQLHRLLYDWRFDADTGDDDPVYVELVDALSYLTSAIQARPINVMDLHTAVDLLRRLRDERGTPCLS